MILFLQSTMFRRSKIKITPKIPQAKQSGDRTHVESLTPLQASSNLTETTISNSSDQTNKLDKLENKSSTVESLEPPSIIVTPKLPKENAAAPVVDLTSSLTTELVESQHEVNNNTIIEKTSIVDESNKSLTDVPIEKAKVNEVSKKTQTAPKLTTLIEPVDDSPQPSDKPVTKEPPKELPKESPTIPSPIIRDKLQTDTVRPRKRIKISPKDLLDRNSITLYHLIHAPISRGKRIGKNKNQDKDKDKDKDKKLDEISDENVEKRSESGDSGKQETSDNKSTNEDTMDSVITTVSSASTIITNNEASGVDKTQEKESIGPRVKVGPDGELIIDEESLVIKKPKPVEKETIEEPAYGKTTYSSFRKRPPTVRWTKTETIEFYTALNLIGPDFSLMSNLFFNGKRSRTDLKNKFRRENKLNKSVIDKALYEADVEYCLAQEAVQSDHS